MLPGDEGSALISPPLSLPPGPEEPQPLPPGELLSLMGQQPLLTQQVQQLLLVQSSGKGSASSPASSSSSWKAFSTAWDTPSFNCLAC